MRIQESQIAVHVETTQANKTSHNTSAASVSLFVKCCTEMAAFRRFGEFRKMTRVSLISLQTKTHWITTARGNTAAMRY